eukprot:scaffold100165_cov44-Phaeocystis_antarctica.AAC.2
MLASLSAKLITSLSEGTWLGFGLGLGHRHVQLTQHLPQHLRRAEAGEGDHDTQAAVGLEQRHRRVVVEVALRLHPVPIPAHISPHLVHAVQPPHEVERGEACLVVRRLALVRGVAPLHLAHADEGTAARCELGRLVLKGVQHRLCDLRADVHGKSGNTGGGGGGGAGAGGGRAAAARLAGDIGIAAGVSVAAEDAAGEATAGSLLRP